MDRSKPYHVIIIANTLNELYRGFRVGNTNTMANAALEPEKSWGPEVAFTMRHN